MDILMKRRQMMIQNTELPPPVFYNYLYFDGTAYIDTDITPAQDSGFRATCGLESTEETQNLFGFSSSNGYTTSVTQDSSTDSTNRQFSVKYDSSSVVVTKILAQTYPAYAMYLTPKNFGFGDSNEVLTKGNTAPNGTLVIGSNGTHSGNPFTGAIGVFRIYDDDTQDCVSGSEFNNYTPIITLQPCKCGNISGLWNVEEGKFYRNSAGSGNLIACSRFTANVSSYVSEDSSFRTSANLSYAYATYTSTNCTTIYLNNGSNAESWIYYKFDTSSIPADARIISVQCRVKCKVSNTSSTTIATRRVQMFSGTTAKGSYKNLTTTATIYKFFGVDWTRAELDDIRFRLYAKRGTKNTTAQHNVQIYGATLDVLYTV